MVLHARALPQENPHSATRKRFYRPGCPNLHHCRRATWKFHSFLLKFTPLSTPNRVWVDLNDALADPMVDLSWCLCSPCLTASLDNSQALGAENTGEQQPRCYSKTIHGPQPLSIILHPLVQSPQGALPTSWPTVYTNGQDPLRNNPTVTIRGKS